MAKPTQTGTGRAGDPATDPNVEDAELAPTDPATVPEPVEPENAGTDRTAPVADDAARYDTTGEGTASAAADPGTPSDPPPEDTGAGAPAAGTAPPPRGPGFFVLLLGGLVAGGIGYLAAAYFTPQDDDAAVIARLDAVEAQLSAPADPDDTPERLAASETGIGTLQSRVDAIEEALAAAPDSDAATADGDTTAIDTLRADLDGLTRQLGDLSNRLDSSVSDATDRLAALGDDLNGLTTRIDDLESGLSDLRDQVQENAAGPTEDDIEALKTQLSDLSAQFDEQVEAQKAAIAEAQQAATAETRRVSAAAAMSRIQSAVENGRPFLESIAAFQEASDIVVPQPLMATASDGVASLTELQRSFDDAARDALEVSLSETAGDGVGNRLTAFLRAQTQARSLDERAGADPDAVLSRAAARVAEGDLPAALDEIANLPPGGQQAMAEWTRRAQARVDARAAADQLSAALNSN
ncbi:hypothetical protein OCGS_1540 [Oceaniovalibus guishaninsula JLT2003]|uniref:Mitochondrial inner membrane protein n=1 Tax=Oceaniovalibus guishaninsula JLT2003 TaxID=1231392 RepID=K2HDU9_9RHOB|nr:hypothetical protein [Oceaniovalibus guishaninsula]EKE44702.1 hypothetical protein OCGS_1540 [Oceaniovalibus guishaninsula JLT2003]